MTDTNVLYEVTVFVWSKFQSIVFIHPMYLSYLTGCGDPLQTAVREYRAQLHPDAAGLQGGHPRCRWVPNRGHEIPGGQSTSGPREVARWGEEPAAGIMELSH